MTERGVETSADPQFLFKGSVCRIHFYGSCVCAHVYGVHTCMCTCAQAGQRMMSGVLLYHSPLFNFEVGFLIDIRSH